MPLARGPSAALCIQLLIGFAVLVQEMFIILTARPHIHGSISRRRGRIAGHVAEETGLAELRVAGEEARPPSMPGVRRSKHFYALLPDIELPEDYKHRCPISCSRTDAALQGKPQGFVAPSGRV